MDWLLHADLAARNWVVLHRIGVLDQPLVLLSVIGRFGLAWYAIALLLAIARRISWRDAARVGIALVLGAVLTDVILKPAVDRARPFTAAPHVADVIGGRPKDASFPSGHATEAFAGATALARVAPHGAPAWWILAAGIAFSRVYLGVHYPFDVIGGAAIGAAVAWLVLTVTRARLA